MMKSFKTLKTGLLAKPLEKPDTGKYFKLIQRNCSHLSQFHVMSEAKYTSEHELLLSIEKPKANKTRYGLWKDGEIVGFLSIVNKGNQRCELGMWIGKDFTRKGYATDAVTSGAKHALKKLGYTRVIATVDPRNEASINTLKKAGFNLVRRFKKRYYFAFTG